MIGGFLLHFGHPGCRCRLFFPVPHKKEMLPEQMQKKRAENNNGKIAEDPDRIWKSAGQIRNDDLGHLIVRTNIEHIDVVRPSDCKIDDRGSTTENRKQDDRGGKAMPRMIADGGKTAEDPHGNQEQMPQIGMARERRKRVVHSARIEKGSDSAKKRKVH